MKIGARIIKTGIAVSLTMFICRALGLEPALFGAVSAVINMQPSIHLTVKTAKDQVFIHVLGVAAGLAAGYLIGGNPVSMGLTTILIIVLYRRLRLQTSVLMGIVAAIFILDSAPDQFLRHAFSRSAVIFAGLSSAMLVNIALWPPRYGRLFREKLRESNSEAVAYFCRAVRDFAHLENQEIEPPLAQKESVLALHKEARTLAEHFQKESKGFSDLYTPVDPDRWLEVAERFMYYNEALIEKAGRIYELLPPRLERRLSSGAPPISAEFHSILELLESGCASIRRVNEKLRASVCDGASVETEQISEAYWERLTRCIEQWQPRLAGTYYLHALLEVAVVANEIRWTAREAKKLLLDTAKS